VVSPGLLAGLHPLAARGHRTGAVRAPASGAHRLASQSGCGAAPHARLVPAWPRRGGQAQRRRGRASSAKS